MPQETIESVPLLFHTAPEGSPVDEVGGTKVVAVAAAVLNQAVPDQIFKVFVVVSSHISPVE